MRWRGTPCSRAVYNQAVGRLGRSMLAVVGVVFVLGGCGSSPDSLEIDAATIDVSGDRTSPLTLRIMSVNLRWGGFDDGVNNWANRRELVNHVFRDFMADSAGLQESTTDQVADVVAAIPHLGSYEFENTTQQIVYDARRFELHDAGGFLLFEGNQLPGSIRYCTWVHLLERTTGRAYYHYNVHLDHREPHSGQLSIVGLIQGIARRATRDPFVVTGDFNATESSPTMTFVRGEHPLPDGLGNPVANPIPLVDTFRVLHPNATDVGTAGGFAGIRTGPKIDYVLADTPITVDEGRDHLHQRQWEVSLGSLPSHVGHHDPLVLEASEEGLT